MKKAILFFALILGLPVSLLAQYSGGNGRGDASLESLNILMNSEDNKNTTSVSTSLDQSYPNPFNSVANIKFNVAKSGDVKIVVYDIMGREVQTLVSESLKPGTYLVSFDGTSLISGVYFYRISAGDYSGTRRLLLEK
jgi:hypothetical protein